MSAERTQVWLVLDPGDGDLERAEEDLRYLLDELAHLDIVGVERMPSGPAPPGTRAAGGVELGALMIAVGGSGATLPMLVGLVRDWLSRRGSGTVRLKIGSAELEMTHASSAMQQQALDEFLNRHAG
jgi:Effector Associated Constant Component 1